MRAWSRARPASTQMTVRSRASGNPRRHVVESGEYGYCAEADQTHEHAGAEVVIHVDSVAESCLDQQPPSARYVSRGKRNRLADGIARLLESFKDGRFVFR